MAEVVITEFMDEADIERLVAAHDTHVDPTLWERPDELKALIGSARGLIVRNKTSVDADVMAVAPRLQVIGRLGVGLDNIDLPTAEARGIEVCTAVGSNAASVAEYVMGAMVALQRGCFGVTDELIAGGWPRRELEGTESAGKTLGIIGFGAIGQAVAKRAAAFEMSVLAYDPVLQASHDAWRLARRCDFDQVVTDSHVISIHAPLTAATRGLIGAAEMARMRPGVLLINAARGGIIDERAVAEALAARRIGGAVLDTFEAEPPYVTTRQAFAGLDRLILTPHIAGHSREANARISQMTADHVLRVLGSAR